MMRRKKSSGTQIERTAKVIQEALMEAAASVRNRKDGLLWAGTDHGSPRQTCLQRVRLRQQLRVCLMQF